MCFIKIVFILQMFVFVMSESKTGTRTARLFSFNTVDEDIRIDLEFSIPFISIPVKKTIDAAFGLSSLGLPTININPASLALGGAVVLGTTVLVPWLVKSYVTHHPHQKYSRLLNTAEFESDDMLEFVSMMLSESQNIRGCALKVACSAGQIAAGADLMMMWKHVFSNRLLSSMINGTAVEDAMLSGRNGRDCDSYKPCPLKDHHMLNVVKSIIMIGKM